MAFIRQTRSDTQEDTRCVHMTPGVQRCCVSGTPWSRGVQLLGPVPSGPVWKQAPAGSGPAGQRL